MFPTVLIDCISSYEPHPPSSTRFPTTSPSQENYFDDLSDPDDEFLDELDSICLQSLQNYPKKTSIQPKTNSDDDPSRKSKKLDATEEENSVSSMFHRPSSYVSEIDDSEESSSWEVSDDETEEEWDESSCSEEDDGISSCCSSSCSSLGSLYVIATSVSASTRTRTRASDSRKKRNLLSPDSRINEGIYEKRVCSSRINKRHVWNVRGRGKSRGHHRRMGAFSEDLSSSFGKLNEFELTNDEKMNMKVCEREHNRLVRKDAMGKGKKLSRNGSMDCVEKKLPFEEETFTQEIWNAWRLR